MRDGGGAGVSAPARRLSGLRGWRRRGAAFGFGALAVFALPPVHALPVLLIAFPGLYWLIRGAETRLAAFFVGWWFGVGYFALGLYWISFALLTDPARFGWMIPFAVGGLSAALAVYPAIAAALVRWAGLPGWRGVVLFALAWTAAEWLRGILFTGFPWNPIGHVWLVSAATAQLAAVTGVYGLSLAAVAAATLPATLAEPGRRRFVATGVAFAVVALLWAGGAARLPRPPDPDAGPVIRIVQPNIPQSAKWRDDLRARHFAKLVRLSAGPERGPAILVWPETAVPYFLANEPDLITVLAGIVPPGGLLITGALRRTPRGERPVRLWNSIHAIDEAGDIVATYDKFHLVPFGEYVPEPFLTLFGFAKITYGSVPFSAGKGPVSLALPGLPPVSMLICYEAIFPGEVVGDKRPGWLLNVTNDGWYGHTAGPHQHFASARMRTIEEGLPLVRAANTGISGVIDPYGRVVARLGLGREGVLETRLPPPLAAPTPYAEYGDGVLAAVAAGLLILIVAPLRKGRRTDAMDRTAN